MTNAGAIDPGSAVVELARRAAGAVHFVLILTGSLVFMQSFHTLNFFHQQGQWASLRDMARTCWQSYLLILKFFMAPFFEARFLDTWLTSQDHVAFPVLHSLLGFQRDAAAVYSISNADLCPLRSCPPCVAGRGGAGPRRV